MAPPSHKNQYMIKLKQGVTFCSGYWILFSIWQVNTFPFQGFAQIKPPRNLRIFLYLGIELKWNPGVISNCYFPLNVCLSWKSAVIKHKIFACYKFSFSTFILTAQGYGTIHLQRGIWMPLHFPGNQLIDIADQRQWLIYKFPLSPLIKFLIVFQLNKIVLHGFSFISKLLITLFKSSISPTI